MLNRRILRIKAFKVLYSYAENPDLTCSEVLSRLKAGCEATRDLYLLLLSITGPLTEEARRRIEAARGKFSPTEEELHPNLKFAENALAPLLAEDPDFKRILKDRGFSWEQYDVLLHDLYKTLKTRPYYQQYMDSPTRSLAEDIRLFKHIFETEFEDNPALEAILEDQNILWTDDLGYALTCVVKSLDDIRKTGRWNLPPLYQSDILKAQGKPADSDERFVQQLLKNTYARFSEYYDKVSGCVPQWDRERLYTTDIVLIAMGLAEAETFPEIPVKVTINEYVEISKYYSTPKSRGFVNGLLDRLIRESQDEGRTVKAGKGLL